MRRAFSIAMVVGGALALTQAPVLADGTITAGTSSFTWHDLSSSATDGNADFRAAGADSTDYVHQVWFWYRVDDGPSPDTREYPFPVPEIETYSGDHSTFVWHSLGHNGASFDATLVATVQSHPLPNAARLQLSLTLSNPSNNLITVFGYFDPDVGGTAGGDLGGLQVAGIDSISWRVDDGAAHTEHGTSTFPALAIFGPGHSEASPLVALLNDSKITALPPGDSGPGDLALLFEESGASAILYDHTINAAVYPFAACSGGFNCAGDFNGDNRVDGRDVPGFLACCEAGQLSGACGCVDFDESGTISAGDGPAFARKLVGIGDPNPACP